MLSRVPALAMISFLLAAQSFAQAPVAPPVAQPPVAAPPATPAAPTYPSQVAGKDLTAWIKELRESQDGYVRETAVKVIPLFGPAARGPALQPLTQQLSKESDPGVRINIILALGLFGSDVKPEEAKLIVTALDNILRITSRGSPVRLHAARSLANYGSHASSAVNTLLNLDEDPAWETRQSIVMALGRISRDPKKGPNVRVLDSLVKRLPKEESAAVRLEIAQSLLILGPPSYDANIPGAYQKAIKPFLDPVVKKLETETDGATRVWLLMTQMTYDGTAFTDANIVKLADNLSRPEPGAKIAALRALALLGEKAKPALVPLLATLKWEDPALLVEAMTAVAALKTLAKDALPDLDRIKAGKDEYLKQIATEAHDWVSGKKAAPAAPAPAPMPMPPKK